MTETCLGVVGMNAVFLKMKRIRAVFISEK
jgi:hypothetical protein